MAPKWEQKPGLGHVTEFGMTLCSSPHRPQASGGNEGAIITWSLECQPPQEKLQNA